MLRRDPSMTVILALAMLSASLCVDAHAVLVGGKWVALTSAAYKPFPLPGPRRYPPGYRAS